MVLPDKAALSLAIKKKAIELGFDIVGIARSRVLSKNKEVLKYWCEAGMNDKMNWLARDIDRRSDPGLLFPGAKTIVVTGMSYYSDNKQKNKDVPILSRYAYGLRYQDVIIKMLNRLLSFIKNLDEDADGKSVVDSAPIFEKAWAQEAGLGWQGKHSIVINKEIGSFFFVGILILNIDLDYDKPADIDHCGTCRLCIERCPTGAINENRTIDTRKCISNLTIENREPVAEEMGPKLEKRVFGCDICQEICPWNRKTVLNNHPEYRISDEVVGMNPEDWLSLSEKKFARLFSNSAVGRVKYENFIHNIALVMKS